MAVFAHRKSVDILGFFKWKSKANPNGTQKKPSKKIAGLMIQVF